MCGLPTRILVKALSGFSLEIQPEILLVANSWDMFSARSTKMSPLAKNAAEHIILSKRLIISRATRLPQQNGKKVLLDTVEIQHFMQKSELFI
jgi:hypothetical protein